MEDTQPKKQPTEEQVEFDFVHPFPSAEEKLKMQAQIIREEMIKETQSRVPTGSFLRKYFNEKNLSTDSEEFWKVWDAIHNLYVEEQTGKQIEEETTPQELEGTKKPTTPKERRPHQNPLLRKIEENPVRNDPFEHRKDLGLDVPDKEE